MVGSAEGSRTGLRFRALALSLAFLPAVPAVAQDAPFLLQDGCFEADMPAWFASPGSASDDPLRVRGMARTGGGPRGTSVLLNTTLAGSGEAWAVQLFVADREGRKLEVVPHDHEAATRARHVTAVTLYRPNEWGNLTAIPLLGGTVNSDDPVSRDLIVGDADLTVEETGRTGRLLLRFRASARGTHQLSDCLAADDPRLDVPAAEAVDAGQFSGTLSLGRGADGSVSERVAYSGPAIVRHGGGVRAQGIHFCDLSQSLTVRIRTADYSATAPGTKASIELKDDTRTVLVEEVPVVPRSEVPDERPYAWFEEGPGGVTGAVRAMGVGALVYEAPGGALTTRSHPLAFEASFRAVPFEERVTALAAPRDYRALSPTERLEIQRQALCGVGAGGP